MEANWKPAVPGPKIPARSLAGSPNHGFKPPSATPVMGTGAKQCWELQGQGFVSVQGMDVQGREGAVLIFVLLVFPSDHQDPSLGFCSVPKPATNSPVTQARPAATPGHISAKTKMFPK